MRVSKRHWSQTPAGRKKLSEAAKARWAGRNGSSTFTTSTSATIGAIEDELDVISRTLKTFEYLSENAKGYIRRRIGVEDA